MPMRRFFTRAGERALRRVLRLRPLLAFDFDGTLAPIVARPDDAHVPEVVSRCLRELADALPTAIHRPQHRRRASRLGFEPAYIVGNHGVEQASGVAPLAAASALDFLRERIAAARERLVAAGVAVEDSAIRWPCTIVRRPMPPQPGLHRGHSGRHRADPGTLRRQVRRQHRRRRRARQGRCPGRPGRAIGGRRGTLRR